MKDATLTISTLWPTVAFPECLDTLGVVKPPQVLARDYKSAGAIPVIDQGQELIAGWTDNQDAAIRERLPFVVFGDHTRIFKFVDFPFALGADGTQLLKPKPIFNPRFFYYACLSLSLPSRGYNRHFSLLKERELLKPPKPEQEKIATVLWKVQRAIEIEDKLVAAARELKQSALCQLFTRGLRGELQKETDSGAVPESWRVDRLVELVHFQRGFDITKKKQQTGSVPVVSSGGIKSWHNEVGAKGPGVVLGRKGSIGSVHYVEQDYWPHDTTLWSTDFRGNFPLFVYYRLLLLDFKKLDSGAANPALNRNFVHEEMVSWPEDIEEQRKIAHALQTVDRKISLHERKRATLQELFKTLLHQLMTGQIRVDKLDIDVSDVVEPKGATA
jgi:type I restriction enzyme, S subunit